jgi:hypothetical protein
MSCCQKAWRILEKHVVSSPEHDGALTANTTSLHPSRLHQSVYYSSAIAVSLKRYSECHRPATAAQLGIELP